MLRKLKCSLASGSNALEEFYSDPHAVAGMCGRPRTGALETLNGQVAAPEVWRCL